MEKLQYKLEAFEGPLDLLLFLITKHKLDIFDINISELLEQYMSTLDAAGDLSDLEGASEFLEMAARLVLIKTAMLLPRRENEGEDLKKALQGELIEYQACRNVAALLGRMNSLEQSFSRAPMKIEADMTYTLVHPTEDIGKAYLSALGKKQRKLPPPVSAFKTIVHTRIVSVATKAVILLKNLYRSGTLAIKELFVGKKREDKVAMFLALLELVKNKRVIVNDDGTSVGIYRRDKGDETVAT